MACFLRVVRTCGLALLLGGGPVLAQSPTQNPSKLKYPTGHLDIDATDLAGIPVATLTRAYIPEAIDLTESFPSPGQQSVGSCVAWATGYAARSYYARFETTPTDHSAANMPSPAYIYNRTYNRQKPSCEDAGSKIPDALRLLSGAGAFALSEYPASQECKTGHPLDQSTPSKFRIAGFAEVGGLGMRQKLNPDLVRQRLSQGHPVVIGMKVDTAFTELKPYEVYAGNGQRSLDELKKLGGHAMVLVGYDDRRRAFRVLNSWGTRWADGGFGWIGYDAAVSQIVDSFVMQTATPPPKPKIARPAVSSVNDPAKHLDLSPCADLRASRMELPPPPGSTDAVTTVRYSGFVSTALDLELVRLDASMKRGSAADVQLRPWPVCEAMLHLREPLAAPSRPEVSTLDGRTSFKVGDTFGLRITAPDVPTFLYAFYLEDDGTVVNLLPRRGPMRSMTSARATIVLGDGREGRATFRVAPLKANTGRVPDERGTEAVIVLAARAPIQELEDLEAPDSVLYRVSAKAVTQDAGPPDRLLLSTLRDLTRRRVEAGLLEREASAAVLQLKIFD